LTIDAIRSGGLSLAGVIINGYDEKTKDLAEKTSAVIVQEFGKVKIIVTVPFDDTTNIEKCIIGQKVIKVLQNIDWLKIIEQK
jgi:dethiobiotin synthetase